MNRLAGRLQPHEEGHGAMDFVASTSSHEQHGFRVTHGVKKRGGGESPSIQR